MRFLPLAALLLVAAAPSKEEKLVKPAPHASPQKVVSVPQVAKVSVAKGTDWTLDEMRARNLGYEAPPVTKEFVLDEESAPTQHAVMVVLDAAGKSPSDLMISSTTAQYSGGQPVSIDGYTFRLDLTGKLLSAIRARGPLDAVMQEKLDTAATETKKRFDAVLYTVRTHRAVKEAKR